MPFIDYFLLILIFYKIESATMILPVELACAQKDSPLPKLNVTRLAQTHRSIIIQKTNEVAEIYLMLLLDFACVGQTTKILLVEHPQHSLKVNLRTLYPSKIVSWSQTAMYEERSGREGTQGSSAKKCG